MTHWEMVIGLEVHTQLSTHSKLFSGASTRYGAAPNTQACVIDVAMPGVLPVLNEEAVKMAVKFGLAVHAHINPYSVFARKNYFYPDLPKGYQISQFEHPIVGKGYLDILLDENTEKRIGITRAHLEEDAGKSLHEDFRGMTGIDLNRSGVPLLEIVSEPDMRSPEEAVAYLKTLHSLVRYLGISDGNMQEGSFRCDVNVSVRPKGTEKFGTRAEIKNLNSFRFVDRAILFEVKRQIEILEMGGTVHQETRLYDATTGETRALRSKEAAHDYRYFPDPDLLPVVFDESFINQAKAEMPELPTEKRQRFKDAFGLSHYDASVLVSNQALATFFEDVTRLTGNPKLSANWVMGDFSARLNENNLEVEESPVKSGDLAQLLQRILDQTISGRIAKDVFEAMWAKEGSADQIIEQKGLKQITDTSALDTAIDQVLKDNPGQLADYRAGRDKLFGFFVGQVMKMTQGKANPTQVNDLLMKKLKG